jgi:16S rRNA G1207 methylase RsmC
MSAPAEVMVGTDDPALDPEVLSVIQAQDGLFVEWGGWRVAQACGGSAWLTWRAHVRGALAAGVTVLDVQPTAQRAVLVRIGKGRVATQADLADAWNALLPEGLLVVVGANDVGIATWIKRLGMWTGQDPEVLVHRARQRVAVVRRLAGAQAIPAVSAQEVPAFPSGLELTFGAKSAETRLVPPGVFSSDGLDRGTAVLLQDLAVLECQPEVIVDVGCGTGHLGLAALRRWPLARLHLLDADRRAVLAATENAQRAGLHATSVWWDDQDAWPEMADLILMNPPAHAGTGTDLEAARRLFRIAMANLKPQGRLRIVANRHLPYERDLQMLGCVEVMPCADPGFKVLVVRTP